MAQLSDKVTVKFGAGTDQGLVRHHNEDRFCAEPDSGLFLVVDGVGGQNAGQVAAEIVCDRIGEFIRDTSDDDDNTWPFGIDPALSMAGNRLRASVLLANRAVSQRLEENEALNGMAATMAAVLLKPASAVVANVGDCRAYLLRESKLQQLTLDHSWVAEQVRAGALAPEAARVHPLRNLVTRAVTGEAGLAIDVLELDVQKGDALLVCSDGLSGAVPDDQIEAMLLDSLTEPQAACQKLVDAANASGGKDNVTVIVVSLI